MGAGSEKDGPVSLPAQVPEEKIPSQPHPQLHLHPQAENGVDLELDQLPRKAVLGNAEAKHASGHRLGLEDGHGIAQETEVVSRGQPRGARPDDGHPVLRVLHRPVAVDLPEHVEVDHALHPETLSNEALEGPDGDGLVEDAAAAGGLAGGGADPPADRGQGIGTPGHGVGLAEAPFADQGHVASRLRADRAGLGTGKVVLQPVPVDEGGIRHATAPTSSS